MFKYNFNILSIHESCIVYEQISIYLKKILRKSFKNPEYSN
jgi:hypothetical protein